MKIILSITFVCIALGNLIAQERPNIIVILADDLGYNDVGFTGETPIQTPNIDALAKSGVIFKEGYVSHPYCGPSRAGLLTGKYQARFGMETNPSYSPFDVEQGVPLEVRFFPEELQKKGYHTGIIGKWHMGAAPPQQPNNRGFDHFFGFLTGGHDYFKTDLTISHYRKGSKKLAYSPVEGTSRPLQYNKISVNHKGYLTDVLSNNAVDFVKSSKKKNKPFFLYLAYNAPHAPLQAPEEAIAKYEKTIKNKKRRTYAAMVDVMDQGIGRLLKALKETGQRENTMIYFLSDNGGVHPKKGHQSESWADNTPFREGKGSMYDGGIHVPFVLSWPAKIKAGSVYNQPVISLDIAATSLKVADSSTDVSAYDGVDLLPFLINNKKSETPPHEALFWRKANGKTVGIRTPNQKLICNYYEHDKAFHYYRVDKDKSENKDLITKEKKEAAKLAKLWNKWNSKNIQNQHIEVGVYQKKREAMFKKLHAEFRKKENKQPLYQIPSGF